MNENHDPSRDPKFTHHYTSHALLIARFSLKEGNLEKTESARGRLISRLESMYSDGSASHFKLSRKCLDYLRQNGEWNSPKKVKAFADWYSKIEENIIGKNPVKAFLEKMKNSS
jgi:hypothetical protein